MVEYTSTRNARVVVDGATAVTDAFSEDGGLYVPKTIPKLSYADLLDLDYSSRVEKVLEAYFDFDVKGVAQSAYCDFDDDPAPTIKLDDNVFVQELWHGKTCSSKDMAYAVLPALIEHAKAAKKMSSATLIPLVTNGDMGKAAAAAFCAATDTRLCVFYPLHGMDGTLKKELCAVDGKNVSVVGVNGRFDDIRSIVKSVFFGGGLNAALADNNTVLSSANSINIGIIVPQIAYYFSAYCDLVNSGEIKAGQKIDFVVPVGNFGGTVAGYYAVKMGLPINKLVCASSDNTAFIDFVCTGEYDINTSDRKSKTSVLSNIERLVFTVSDNNAELTAERMNELEQDGRFSVTEHEVDVLHGTFAGNYVSAAAVKSAVSYMFDEYGYAVDTHTAAACSAAISREFVHPTVILSLANPYKTAVAFMQAIGKKATEPNERLFRLMEDETALDVPQTLLDIFSARQVHDAVIEPQDIAEFLSKTCCKK